MLLLIVNIDYLPCIHSFLSNINITLPIIEPRIHVLVSDLCHIVLSGQYPASKYRLTEHAILVCCL